MSKPRHGGPSTHVDFDDELVRLFCTGMSMRDLAKSLEVAIATIYRRCTALGLSRPVDDGARMKRVLDLEYQLLRARGTLTPCSRCETKAVGRFRDVPLCGAHLWAAVKGAP